MENHEIEFSRLVKVRDIGDKEKSFSISAKPEELKKLTKRMNVININFLEAEITLLPSKSGKRLRLKGNVKAELVQECVVSLEAITTKIDESFEVVFDSLFKKDDSIDFSVDESMENEIIEPLTDKIDIGEVTSEHLGLFIDLYPRKEGVAFEYSDKAMKYEDEKEAENPFSVLKKLKFE